MNVLAAFVCLASLAMQSPLRTSGGPQATDATAAQSDASATTGDASATSAGASETACIVAAAQKVGAFALPASSPDAAVLITVPPGSYTVQAQAAAGANGIALIEVYEVP